MPRHLRLLPRSEAGISALEKLHAPCLEPADLVRDIDIVAFGRLAKLGNALFELSQRLLEFEVGLHRAALVPGARARKRMALVDQCHQPRGIHMGVYLGGGDIGMAEQRLKHPQVRPAFEQMRGEGMAQDMRA